MTPVAEKHYSHARDERGHFREGNPGGGRHPGSKDEIPRTARKAFAQLYEEKGGDLEKVWDTIVHDPATPAAVKLGLLVMVQKQLNHEDEVALKKGKGGPDYQVIFTKREKGYDPPLDPTHPCNQRRQLPARSGAQDLAGLASHHVKAPIPVLETPEGEPLDVVDDD